MGPDWKAALALGLASLVAGCSDASPADPVEAATEPSPQVEAATEASPAPSPYETFESHGVTGYEVGTSATGGQTSPGFMLLFEAREGATGFLIELAWNDTMQDMDIGLGGPKQCLDMVPFPDSTVTCMVDIAVADGTYCHWARWNQPVVDAATGTERLVLGPADLERCGPGEWYTWASTRTANVQVPFHLYATVFYDGSDPAAFTAIPWAGQQR